MTELIRNQTFNVITMFSCGMILAAAGQMVNWYQAKRQPNAVIQFVQDLLYWSLSGLLAAAFLYYCSYGKISVHTMASLVTGALFWSFCVGKKITFFMLDICDIIMPRCRGTK